MQEAKERFEQSKVVLAEAIEAHTHAKNLYKEALFQDYFKQWKQKHNLTHLKEVVFEKNTTNMSEAVFENDQHEKILVKQGRELNFVAKLEDGSEHIISMFSRDLDKPYKNKNKRYREVVNDLKEEMMKTVKCACELSWRKVMLEKEVE
jgi:hypothetical protein